MSQLEMSAVRRRIVIAPSAQLSCHRSRRKFSLRKSARRFVRYRRNLC